MTSLRAVLRTVDATSSTWWLSHRARLQGRRAAQGSTVLLVPPATPGSMGDEAMVLGLSSRLLASGHLTKVLLPGGEGSWPGIPAEMIVKVPRLYERRPGSAEHAAITALGPGDRVLLIGADVLDGAYDRSQRDRSIGFALAAIARGAAVDVVSFSLRRSGDGSRMLRRLLENADRVVARDALTVALCQSEYGRTALLAPDAAFLVPTSLPCSAWHSDAPVILNVSAHAETQRASHNNRAVGDLATELADGLASAFAGKEHHFVTFSHDSRPKVGDFDALERLESALAGVKVATTRYSTVHPDPQETRSFLNRSSLVMTGRMHMAIASLAAGIPVIGLSYHDKWEGLWKLFDMPKEMLLEVRNLDANAVNCAFNFGVDHGKEIAAHIAARAPEVVKAARLHAGPAAKESLAAHHAAA